MSVNSNSGKTNHVGGSMTINSILKDLKSATNKIHSIKKIYDEMANDVKVSEMVQDQTMIEHARMKSELQHVKQRLAEKQKQIKVEML